MDPSPFKSNLQITQLSQTIDQSHCLPCPLPRNIKSFLNATPCFTDRSILRNRVGFAYSIGNKTTSCRHQKTASILTAKLQTIFQYLEEILILPSHIVNPSSILPHLMHGLPLLTHSHHQHILNTPTCQPQPHPPLHLLHHPSHHYPLSGSPGIQAFREMRKSTLTRKKPPTSSASPRTFIPLEPTYPDLSANKPSNFGLSTGRAKLPRIN